VLDTNPQSLRYSPECVEVEFSEVGMQQTCITPSSGISGEPSLGLVSDCASPTTCRVAA
jgi:hypothetical protein